MIKPKPHIRPSEALRRANRRLGAIFEPEAGLTVPQALVLNCLSDGRPQTQAHLVVATGIDRSTLSTMLESLRLDEWVTVRRSDADRRATVVTITPVGTKALKRGAEALLGAERCLMAMVPSRDRAAFLRGLRAIAEAP